MIIDCKSIAANIYSDLAEEIASSDCSKLATVPTLGAILVGENSPSMRYINQKRKFCEKVGMNFVLKEFPANIAESDLLEQIFSWNESSEISGYIVQLPLPKSINETCITNAIDSSKDVDGFHPINQGKNLIGNDSAFAPCTPSGVMRIIEEEKIDLKGKQVVVIGKSNIVGKPVANMCINMGATVISCNSKTSDISIFTKTADIVICAAGVPGLLKPGMIGKDTVVIDVGFSVIEGKIYGDAETEEIDKQGNMITSVPGGVGVLTVAMLLKNTLKAWKQQNNI